MRDTRLRIFGQLVINIVSFVCFYLMSVTEYGIDPYKLIFYTIITTFIVWELLRLGIMLTRKFYPGIALTKRRLWIVSLITMLIVVIIPYIKFFLGELIDLYPTPQGPIQFYPYLRLMGQNIFYCIFIAAIYEAMYFFDQWKILEKEKEAMRRENLRAQFASLKGQVQPHFLFNTLNTLSSLIHKDADRAERFVEGMSDVYRYVLKAADQLTVPLSEELDFIHAYADLLTSRFGKGFELTINVDDDHGNYLLPPLCLQLLVENAVKHNAILPDSPLQVTIETKNEHLVVTNNINKKHISVPSEKKGLSSIITRYRLLHQPDITIVESATSFTVTLPLLKHPVYESADH